MHRTCDGLVVTATSHSRRVVTLGQGTHQRTICSHCILRENLPEHLLPAHRTDGICDNALPRRSP